MAQVMKRVRLGPQGRAVIPSEFRRQLKLSPGDELVAWIEDGRLILQRRDDIQREIWDMFKDVKVSMAEELIAERRREAAREL
jgi:AbrB family looped-hinge helix DNA binding protein